MNSGKKRDRGPARRAVALLCVAALGAGLAGCGSMACRVAPPAGAGDLVRLGEVPSAYSLDVEVVDARMERGRLVVEVMVDGGCVVDDLALFSTASFLDAVPPSVDVVVAARGRAGCEGALRSGGLFELGPLTERLLEDVPRARSLVLRVHPAAGGEPMKVSTYRL